MLKIAVLISGGGSNLQAIIDEVENKNLNCSIEAVISDNEKAYGLKRAEKMGIPTFIVHKKEYKNKVSDKVLEILKGKVDLIVLAGFLSILQGQILKEFKDRIINIHPSLIPAFSGEGMYGMKVHEAAIKKEVKFSGCTVHFVDEEVDGGKIILQAVVPVYKEDNAKTLAERVLIEEHKLLPEAVRQLSFQMTEARG